jgi:gliding motility-associated-like protein
MRAKNQLLFLFYLIRIGEFCVGNLSTNRGLASTTKLVLLRPTTTDSADQMKRKYLQLLVLIVSYLPLSSQVPGKYSYYKPPATQGSACNNVDFENGDFTGWAGGIGFNDSSTTPLVVTLNGIHTLGLNAPEPSCSYHTLVTTSSGKDPFSKLPMLDPGGGQYALRLGGENINLNDHGVCKGLDTVSFDHYSNGETIQQTFPVTAANAMFSYKYAVVLNTGYNHSDAEQAYFKTEVLDSAGNPVPCLQFYVAASIHGLPPGFMKADTIDNLGDSAFSYCNWKTNSLNLSAYTGHRITVRFTAAGCTFGGHFSTAYVDCSCSNVQLTFSSAVTLCTGQHLTMNAPPGADSYQWNQLQGSAGIVSDSNSVSCTVNASGKYQVTVTNGTCSYTLDTVLTFLTSPVPSSVSTNPTCYGASNGSATVTLSTGIGPFTYSWNSTPPQSAATANALTSGCYTVTVNQPNGCVANSVVTLTEPPALILPSIPPATICLSHSVSLTPLGMPSGGTAPLSVVWTCSGVPVASPVFPPTTTTYTATTIDSNGCVSLPQFFTVNVNPPLSLSLSGPPPLCPGATGALNAIFSGGDGIWNLSWMPSAGLSSSTIANPLATPSLTTTYTVILSDNCGTPADTETIQVRVFPSLPVVNFSTPDTAGCVPLCVNFAGTSTPSCLIGYWNFGDTSATLSACGLVRHCYMNPGSYSVLYHVTDINGCVDSAAKPAYINVFPLPVAAFTMTPASASLLNPVVYFTDMSIGASRYHWHFGDLLNDTSSLHNPMFTYQDTGCYMVQLTVESAAHCFSSMAQEVCIHDIFAFYAPDSFTPNGDGLNDIWLPKGNNVDPNNYDLSIFDRWGNQLFSTHEWGMGWDGHANSGPLVAQQDIYVWKVSLQDLQGNAYSYIGSIHLIN